MRRLADCLVAGLIGMAPAGLAGQVSLEAAYLVDGFHHARGGELPGGEVLHKVDLMATVDGEAVLGVPDLELFVYVLANAGGSLSERVGDWQGASNIEAPTALRIGELWVQKGWSGGSLLVGLYDLNSEFYVAETGLLFLNSAHGIGPEFGASGVNGPSIFPVTALAARLRLQPHPDWYGLAGVFDGVPGDPQRPAATAVRLSREEGVLLSVEVGHRRDREGGMRYRKVALGGWAYTAEFEGALYPDRMRRGTFGLYLLGEIEVLRESGSPGEGLMGYGRVGYADRRVHPVSWGWGGGVVYTGLLPGRDADRAGVGVAGASHSGRFMEAQRASGEPRHRTEVALEATYAADVASWLRVQPNLQYVLSPGMRPDLEDALLLGVRLELSI